jgi:hypothetical protein
MIFKNNFKVSQKYNITLVLLTLTVTVFLTGCLTIAVRDDKGPGAPLPNEESFHDFTDVPFPATMVVEGKNTYTYMRRGIMSGVVTAVGRFTAEELAAFFDEHLPRHGWSPLAEAQSSKLVSTWTKGKKVLTIITTPVTFAIGSDIRLELWVAPPHTKEDLSQRVIYDTTQTGEKNFTTKPVRQKGGIDEETL